MPVAKAVGGRVVSQSAQVAIIKYLSLGGLTHRHFCLTVLEDGKPEIRVPGESSLTGLQVATFSLCPLAAERGCSGISSSSYRDTNSIMGAHDLI